MVKEDQVSAAAAVEGAGSVLVVDDDAEIRELVAEFLREHGYAVRTASSGAAMTSELYAGQFDLIVLDLMLPGLSGLELCRELRKSSDVPVIMLTAMGEEIDRIVGLEMGADDYLSKPFNPRELLARVKAVLRRVRAASGSTASRAKLFEFAGWRLDTLKRELTNPAGVVVDLSTGEYDLLLAFLEAPQRVLSRDQLLEAARGPTADAYDRAIDVQVSRLRRKIESDSQIIKTVRGAGYTFASPVMRR
jgi:two-component system OmpR family response regulator